MTGFWAVVWIFLDKWDTENSWPHEEHVQGLPATSKHDTNVWDPHVQWQNEGDTISCALVPNPFYQQQQNFQNVPQKNQTDWKFVDEYRNHI
jgi:hypothetical protein